MRLKLESCTFRMCRASGWNGPKRQSPFTWLTIFRAPNSVAAHMMRVSETAHWLEWQDWANPVLQRPYEVKDGKLHIPDVPGIGLEWDEKAVAAYG